MLRSEGSETNRQTLPENSLFLSDEKQKPPDRLENLCGEK